MKTIERMPAAIARERVDRAKDAWERSIRARYQAVAFYDEVRASITVTVAYDSRTGDRIAERVRSRNGEERCKD